MKRIKCTGSPKQMQSENVRLREWKNEIRTHVEKFVVPILKKDINAETASEELLRRLCESLSQVKEFGYHCLPIAKRAISIRQIKQSNIPVESFISKESYRYSHNDIRGSKDVEGSGSVLLALVQADGGLRNHLYLADASARVVVLMIHPKAEYANAVVLIKEWKYLVPDSDSTMKLPGYIEATGEIVVLLPNQSCAERQSKVKELVGIVTHVSSILNYQTWDFTMTIQAEKDDTQEWVVVKNKSLAYLFQALTIGTLVSCTSMKHVTMKWNGRSKSLYCLEETGSIEILENFVEITSLNNDLFKKYMRDKLEIYVAEQELFYTPDFNSYIGEITNIVSNDLGIYILDGGDAILHTAYQPCVDYGIGRRIGSLIMVTYAHQFQDACGKLNLVCCRKSNIKVIKFSNFLSSWRPIRFLGNKFLVEISKCNNPIHPQQLIHIDNFMKSLCRCYNVINELRQLHPDRLDSVLCKLLVPNWNTVCETAKHKHSSAYTEVFSEPHTCVASQSMMKPAKEYHIFSIKELCDEVLRNAKDYYAARRRDYWNHTILSDNLFLSERKSQNDPETCFIMGCIDSNENGKIILSDDSGVIVFVMMMEDHEETNDNGVKCFRWCTQDIGCLVRIRRFSIVIEMLNDPTTHSESQGFDFYHEPSMPCHNFYIVALSTDVQVICTNTKDVSVTQLGCAGVTSSDVSTCKIRSCIPGKATDEQQVTNLLVCVTQQPTPFNDCILKGYIVEDSQSHLKTVTFDLKKVKKWLPFIRARMFLKITIPRQKESLRVIVLDCDCSIFHHHVEDHPLLRDIPVEKIWSFKEVIARKQSLPIRGKIVSRLGHIDRNSHRQRLQFTSINESSTSAELCIYLGRTSELNLPNGLVPGCIAVITPGKICMSEKGNIYCKSCRAIDVEWIPANPRTSTVSETSIKSMQHDEDGSCKSTLLQDLLSSSHSSSDFSTSHPTVIRVFPVEVLRAWITVDATDTSLLDLTNGFYAKSTVSDHTDTAILHFHGNSFPKFFKFIGVGDFALQQFIETIEGPGTLSYNIHLHHPEMGKIMETETSSQYSKDLRVWILLCNNANVSILPSMRCLVQRIKYGYKKAKREDDVEDESSLFIDESEYHHLQCIRFLD